MVKTVRHTARQAVLVSTVPKHKAHYWPCMQRVMDNITYDDFIKLQMVVARIVSAEPIKGKTRIMKGVVDCGGGDERTVIIGGAQYYSPEEMIGRKAVVVTNLEPKSVAGVESGAMLLAADVNNKPFWLVPDEADQVPIGSIIR